MYLQVIGKHKDHYSDGDEYQFGNADTDVWVIEQWNAPHRFISSTEPSERKYDTHTTVRNVRFPSQIFCEVQSMRSLICVHEALQYT